jgi:PAS domain S-box-containing protein
MPTRPAKSTGTKHAPLTQQQAESETLFASIGEGIVATDGDGRITRINEAALAILCYKEKESDLIGQWFPTTVVATYEDGSPIDMMDRPVTRAILTGKTVSTRTSYRRPDGSLVPVALTVSPIMQQGKPTGAIEVFRDISLDIKTDKMKTDFISVASHQLRTPLSAINVYSHMLDDGMAGDLSEDQSAFIKNILTSVDRMNSLINILLNITRIEAGGVNVKLSSVKLQELVEEISKETTVEASKKGLEVISKVDDDVPVLNTDGLLIREIMANLLSNAVKYTPKDGKITIQLQLEGNNVVFSVHDTGFGIPLSSQEHIFTKFFRADNILSEDVSGTGLGLYLTKTIAESLNGELWFTSKEKVGSSFYFSLPKQGSIARHGKFKLDS